MSPTVKTNRSIETNLEMKEVGISRQNLLNSCYNYVQGFTGNDRKDGESQWKTKAVKKNQMGILGLKNTISEMKILLMGLWDVSAAEETFSDLEDRQLNLKHREKKY